MASLETRALQACWDSSTAGQINVCPFGRVLLSIACVVHHSCYEMGAFNEFWESVDPSVWSYANLQAHLITNGLVWPFWERKEIIRKKCEDSPPPGTTPFSFQWALWLAIPQWSLKPDRVQLLPLLLTIANIWKNEPIIIIFGQLPDFLQFQCDKSQDICSSHMNDNFWNK